MSARDNARPLLVMKFGGTSVGSVDALQQVIQIIRTTQADWQRMVVVVSALAGVTDLLLNTATSCANGDTTAVERATAELLARHDAVIRAFYSTQTKKVPVKGQIHSLIEEFRSLCLAIGVLGEATPRALDAIAGLGERMCVRLLAAVLETQGIAASPVDATELIVTDASFQSATPDMDATWEKTRRCLPPLLEKGIIPIVTGFIGATPSGVPTTLGRGGSDYSAAIIGAVLPASEVWIWTDVDGVMTADPHLIPEARTIPELSFREVAELAYYGAKVLHPKTIRPVIDRGIGLRVCNTFSPANRGTYLVAERKINHKGVIKAITAIRGLQLVTVEGRGMLGVPGVAARTFAAVARTGTSVPLISQASSEQSICFAVPQDASANVITALESEFALEMAHKDIDRVWATSEVVIMTVVGEGMRNTPGVAGRVFSALGDCGANVEAIAQGSSEVSISMVLDAADTLKATRALHNLIT